MKRTTIRTALCVVLALVLVVAAVGGGFVWSKLDKVSYDNNTTVRSTNLADMELLAADGIEAIESTEKPVGDVFADQDVINVLFIGSDERIIDNTELGYGDVCVLVSINKATGDVKLVSFQGGISVSFDVAPNNDILAHAYHWGGEDLMTNVVRDHFLLDVEGYISVGIDTFPKIIDALDGVDITLTAAEADALNGKAASNATTKNAVAAGVNHLDGYDALQFCRLLAGDTDRVRNERQRNTLQAIMVALKDKSLDELNTLADSFLPLVHTDLSKAELSTLIMTLVKNLGATAEQMTVPASDTAKCDFAVESENVKAFIYG